MGMKAVTRWDAEGRRSGWGVKGGLKREEMSTEKFMKGILILLPVIWTEFIWCARQGASFSIILIATLKDGCCNYLPPPFKVFIEFVRILLLFYVLAFGCKACEILAPQPGMEPVPSVLEGEALTTGSLEKSL